MDEPIAIIGVDCRFPGDGDTPDRFYEFLLDGRSARTDVPRDRWDPEAFYHPDGGRHGKVKTKTGHFVKGSVAAFDAPFFSITPEEAAAMDPQQRVMLECTYRALENAGISLLEAAQTPTGCYVGCFSWDYAAMLKADVDARSRYSGLNSPSILSNRVSWFFDFRGPSMTIDTACSSSLVAVSEACMGLKLRETSMAIVGGCNLMLSPDLTLELDALGVLSPDGKSQSFDHKANGYARGEGVGVIVLKRMSDALKDGDTIRAVIRGCSSNQDGRSPGISQPTKAAQAALIKHVYTKARLDPSLTRYFEAREFPFPSHHGWKAIASKWESSILICNRWHWNPEASAISEIFTPHRSASEPLFMGALKSNIGHLEGAAGIAGMIKGIYTLERGVIPANAWFEKLNPRIPESYNFTFPTKATPWPQKGLRRMSINSFGFGGANAHVVMDDAYHFLQSAGQPGNHRTVIYPVLKTLKEPKAFEAPLYANIDALLNGDPKPHVNGHAQPINGRTNGSKNGAMNGLPDGLTDGHTNGAPHGTQINNIPNGYKSSETGDQRKSCVAKALRNTTTEFPQMFVLSSYDQDGILRLLGLYQDFLDTQTLDPQSLCDLSYTLGCKRTHHAWRSFVIADSQTALRQEVGKKLIPTRAKSALRLAFVFTGQGAQWAAMGRELMRFSAFRYSLHEADRYMTEACGASWSLAFEFFRGPEDSRLDEPAICQPICTALQVALVDLLASWNIHAQAVVGHSSGEIAAAYAAGYISKEAAWRISYWRGKLCSQLISSPVQPPTGMAAVALDMTQAEAVIERVNSIVKEGSLEIACMNSPESHTVSGHMAKIEALVDMLKEEGVFARKLVVDIAYHSSYLKPISEEYARVMGEIEPGKGKAPKTAQFFSSAFGTFIPDAERLRMPSYWVTNLVSPVRFNEAVLTMLLQEGGLGPITDFLEIGPHSALKGPLRTIIEHAKKGSEIQYASVLRRKESGIRTSLEAAGTLFCRGYNIRLSTVNYNVEARMMVDLPRYPFNHSKEYWAESRISKNFRNPIAGRHELLGAPSPDWNQANAMWRNWIRLSENPWLEDHKIAGDILYPAAGMLVMAIEASRQIAEKSKVVKGFKFKDVSFHSALRVPNTAQGVESSFCLRPHKLANFPMNSAWSEFQLFVMQDDEWMECCSGMVQTEYEAAHNPVDGGAEANMTRFSCLEMVTEAWKACNNKLPTEQVYLAFQNIGLDFGPVFRTLKDVSLGKSLQCRAVVNSTVPILRKTMPHEYVQPHLLHPTTLDGLLQANIVPLMYKSKKSRQSIIPTYVEDFWISAAAHLPHDSYVVASQGRSHGRQEAESTFTAVHPETGESMVRASKLILKTLPGDSPKKSREEQLHQAYNVEWKPDPLTLRPEQLSRTFAVSDPAPEAYAKYAKDCEELCVAYIRRLLKAAGGSGVAYENQDRYLAWMLHVDKMAPKEAGLADLKALEDRVGSNGGPEGKMVLAVGRSLSEILAGTVKPQDVLFQDNLAEEAYRDSVGVARCYAQLTNYLDALAHKNPAIEVLEIGGGTGGATKAVMAALSGRGQRYQHYTFTDISPAFLEQARDTYKDQGDLMSFQPLDIEWDPLAQGFTGGQYDLIVAANVLHAVSDINGTLRHVRQLLKPGGKLVLYELTEPTWILVNFCFGLFPGWWLAKEKERQWSPLMRVESWEQHLVRTGFQGIEAVFKDFEAPSENRSSIIVAGVPPAPREKVLKAAGVTYLVCDPASDQQQVVAAQMARRWRLQGTTCEVLSMAQLRGKDLRDSACIVLAELDTPVLASMAEDVFATLKALVSNCKSLVWLTKGGTGTVAAPNMELITGLARVVRTEKPGFPFFTLSFEENASLDVIREKTASIIEFYDGTDNTFRIIDDMVHVPRLADAKYLTEHLHSQTAVQDVVEDKLTNHTDRSLSLEIGTIGLLDTLRFADDGSVDTPLGEGEIEFKTMACGMNFRDLATCLGKVEETELGLEASGIVTRVGAGVQLQAGDRVFGLCFTGAMRTRVRTPEGLVATMPEGMTFAEAASIPLVYTTAYAILLETGTLRRGDTVLVHSAAGGFGQAVIQLAQRQGAEVFATCGSVAKRDFLEATYGLPRDHIFSSRDLSFKSQVLRLTRARGVDLVVNSLAGDVLRATWDLVAPFGRFVELGLGDILANARVPMGNFVRNCRFEAFELVYMARLDPARVQRYFQRMVDLVVRGPAARAARQTPVTVYPFSRAQAAFRHMQSGQHIGKLVLTPLDDDDGTVPVVPRRAAPCRLDPDASYVLVGGLGGVGRALAEWMVARGARHLILLSRRGAATDDARAFVQELRATCRHVAAPPCDVADRPALEKAIAECMGYMPPIKGCIQGAMVLKDGRFAEDMQHADWQAATRPKVQGSWNLHEVLGDGLDFLVLLSSVIGVAGGAEQANYAAANTFLDALARHCAARGHPAVALDLPVLADVGFVAAKPALFASMTSATTGGTGWAHMAADELLAALDFHCRPPPATALPKAERRRRAQVLPRFWLPPMAAAGAAAPPPWRDDALFAALRVAARTRPSGEDDEDDTEAARQPQHVGAQLARATTAAEAAAAVLAALLGKLGRVLGLAAGELDAGRPLHAYGVDSLVAVELRSWLARDVGADLSVFDLTSKPSLDQLAAAAAAKSRFLPRFAEAEAGP